MFFRTGESVLAEASVSVPQPALRDARRSLPAEAAGNARPLRQQHLCPFPGKFVINMFQPLNLLKGTVSRDGFGFR